MNDLHTSSQTASSSKCRSYLQQVSGVARYLGMSRHLAPVFRIQSITSRQALSLRHECPNVFISGSVCADALPVPGGHEFVGYDLSVQVASSMSKAAMGQIFPEVSPDFSSHGDCWVHPHIHEIKQGARSKPGSTKLLFMFQQLGLFRQHCRLCKLID